MGLTPETTYLYIQGHGLKDGVVLPLLTPVCHMLRRERERDINNLAMHETQRQNELSGYRNSSLSIDDALKKSMSYRQSQPYQWLRRDITTLLEEVIAQRDKSTSTPSV